jgi:alanine-synthesizing transaminase
MAWRTFATRFAASSRGARSPWSGLGYDIVSLNIGNPYAFGFRTPETMRLAMIENLRNSEGYVHQKGIFPAREAVVMQQQERGVRGVTAEEVFIGNGVSELIDLTLRALLNPGDEVLVPSPDYPLWTAAVNLNTGRAVHYPCHASSAASFPIRKKSKRSSPSAPAPSSSSIRTIPPARCIRARPEAIARIAERHRLVVYATRSTIRFCTMMPSSCPWRPWCTTRCAAR